MTPRLVWSDAQNGSAQNAARILRTDHDRAASLLPADVCNSTTITATINGAGPLLLKLENLLPTGSFKVRGAMTTVQGIPGVLPAVKAEVFTASSGNHGLAVAYAAARYGLAATVVLPEDVSLSKYEVVRQIATRTIVHGADCLGAERHAANLAARDGATYVSPYNHLGVLLGHATIAAEIVRDHPHVTDVFVSVGGGGLFSALAVVLQHLRPDIRLHACFPQNSAPLYWRKVPAALRAHEPTLASAVAGDIDPDSITIPLSLDCLTSAVTCSENQIATAMKHLMADCGQRVEGAAALAVAGWQKLSQTQDMPRPLAVLCGGNITESRHAQVLGQITTP
ncbi:pyridoxal-phosphate dependent enzyme [uncultured Pseudosulfitobacter sp.]|uniref:pyridoxal-phosphate dependent enzyme n=1 Tax=uncultured Pseudosulfitobacter sp. TaxID=2854214 RepID=UPI0030DAD389